jgi:hypothetical protein
MTAPTRTAHARFTLASALVRLAFRVCPNSFSSRFVEETIYIAEETPTGEFCEYCGFQESDCAGHNWTPDGTQRID